MTAKLFEEKKVLNWKRYFLRKDKKVVPVEANLTFLSNEQGDITGGVGILRDMTERIKAENEII